jgi:hypothetical protein
MAKGSSRARDQASAGALNCLSGFPQGEAAAFAATSRFLGCKA